MKILYIECKMGAAGDMLMGALSELLPDRESFISKLNALKIPGVEVSREDKESCGIKGSHIRVSVYGEEEDHHRHSHHHHRHYGPADINKIIDDLNLSDKIRKDAQDIYKIIADSESHVHGVDMENIHFHEVGSLDAVTDVVGCCLLMEELAADKVIVSPIHVGGGSVKCAHGILPVPAPATALILQDIPVYGSNIDGELCTPTGAAVLKHFADEFGPVPEIEISKIGYGMGRREFRQANCVRAMLGEGDGPGDSVIELACNIDDMTSEDLAYAADRLMEAGALDVYTEPVVMKKSRLAFKLVCMVKEQDRERMAALIFRHTDTIGIREYYCRRYVLHRHEEISETPWGSVRIKVSGGYGVYKAKAEHDDLVRIASENNLTVKDVREAAVNAWKQDRSVIK